MTRDEFLEIFWRYYQSLEEDFENTIRYVSLNENNFNAFSIEYARLLQAICSELEIVLKQICNIDDNNYYNIGDLAKKIVKIDENFLEHTVNIKKYMRASIRPFKDNVNSKGVPFWWLTYDNIKHNRKVKMSDSNLKCVLYALSALYFCEDYLLKQISNDEKTVDVFDEPSSLFASDIHKRHVSFNNDIFAEIFEEDGITYLI